MEKPLIKVRYFFVNIRFRLAAGTLTELKTIFLTIVSFEKWCILISPGIYLFIFVLQKQKEITIKEKLKVIFTLQEKKLNSLGLHRWQTLSWAI